MLLKHFFVEKIAHSSYMLAGSAQCAVVDPARDVDLYLDEARSRGLSITHVLLTHLHADFISGHLELARRTGAAVYAPRSAECVFEHVRLREGDTIEIEDILLRVIETPGHTPEHISYVVVDRARGDKPVGVFCGDTLFVADVGRPDLFPGRAEELAAALHNSLFEKLLRLPDYCEVYPAHGAGTLCGRSVGAKYGSTIGYERRLNAPLAISAREEFIASLTNDMPPPPDHFSRCSEINRRGPALEEELAPLRPFDPAAFRARVDEPGVFVLDVRGYDAFGSQHVPGAWHIDSGGNFPTFAGWVLPPGKRILLVAQSSKQAEAANVWARRVGVDGIEGYLEGGMFAWAVAGLPTAYVAQISALELHEMVQGTESFTLIDVRSRREFEDGHIEGAVNIPAPDLRARHAELDPAKRTVLICSTGHRSSLGASILVRHGFERVMNAAGGMKGYSAAGYARECAACEVPHGSRYLGGARGGVPGRDPGF